MKKAEKILDKHYQPKMHWQKVNRRKVLTAMSELLHDFFKSHAKNYHEGWTDYDVSSTVESYLNSK